MNGSDLSVRVPGYGHFTVTGEAATMIGVFGGTLHCYQGAGGCRKRGLYFSRTEPKKYLRCLIASPENAETTRGTYETTDARPREDTEEITISVSHELAGKLDGAVLDFGTYNKMQRFVWLTIPGVHAPSCTCLRSIGAPGGKRSPCLDDRGLGLSEL